MAEIDLEKVGRSDVDPITGSILSQEVRNSLLKKTTFDASVLRNDLLAVEGRRREIDLQNTNVIREQENVLLGFNSNIQALRADIVKLGAGLANIATLLQQDSTEEQSRLRTEQERQRRLAERQIRIGKENEIEQKIQNAVTAPAQRLVPKVQDLFGNIKNALFILFGGWLTSQVVQAIKASEEGNTKLFNDIKFNIIKNLAIIGGGLLAIKTGFSLVKTTIGRIASGLTRLLITKPLALTSGLFRNVFGLGRGPKTPTPAGPKPSGDTKGPGIFGASWAAIDAFMNLKNGEYVDSVMRVLGVFGPGRFVKGLMIAGYASDQIAEIFGLNIFGKDPNKERQAKEVVEEAKKQKEEKPPTVSTKPTSTPPAAPIAQPQTPMMGEQKLNQTPATPSPSPERVSQFEQAWKLRNAGWAKGRIEGDWNKMSDEEKRQAKEWVNSKGYDWEEMKLKDSPTMANQPQTPPPAKESAPSAQMAAPAQIAAPPKEPVKVGQLPEPKPSLTMIKTSNNTNQQSNVPATNGALSDVPLINSANPDNFYVLYSQLIYNVVI